MPEPAPEATEQPLAIEEYGLVGDCRTAALVGRNGSLDWLCWPRFDGGACFAALLGDARQGRWRIAPAAPAARTTRRYVGDTLILETLFETAEGSAAVLDLMPVGGDIVEGCGGRVPMRMQLVLRFDYGSSVPWVTRLGDGSGIMAVAGPNLAVLRTPVALRGENLATVADFTVGAGERIPFVLSYSASHRPPAAAVPAEAALEATWDLWSRWAGRCTHQGPWRDAMVRSLLTLKALTFAETGGIVAVPTTSLPEQLGGPRNWDYRYCWLRDATLTLSALMGAGYFDEAKDWRDWLQRAVAGSPDDMQIMYGIAGERRLAEWEVPWLPGYQGAVPVRIGNAAPGQLQLDVWGEMMDALHLARAGGLASRPEGWALQREALRHLGAIWREPDDGIWEVRGGRRQFTHSKVMAWVAFDRMVRDAEAYGLEAPLDAWRATRDEIHATVCREGFDARIGSFTQSFGSPELDASLLLVPATAFLPADDPRVVGTIAAVERALTADGFVLRYRTESGADGLPPGEGVFLPRSFWLADAFAATGRPDEAHRLFERLLALRNDLGLLSEEFDVRAGRQVGNFPQAFSHVALVQTALSLHDEAPVRRRLERDQAGG
jgi:GH15 family glucan-1,4-alpha-glucosidase